MERGGVVMVVGGGVSYPILKPQKWSSKKEIFESHQ